MGFLDEEEAPTYKPWFRGYLGANTATDALRKVAATLSEEYDLKIIIDPTKDAVAHSNSKEKTITLGTKGIYTKGSDYYVGLLLHEIGHIRHSPVLKDIKEIENFKNPIIAKSTYNMLEDLRIEEKMKDEYSGAHLYFDDMNRSLLGQVKSAMGSNLYGGEKTVEDWLRTRIDKKYKEDPAFFGKEGSEEIAQKVAAYTEGLKEALLYKTCGLAILTAKGIVEYDSSTTCDEADKMATIVAQDIYNASNSNLTDEEITAMTLHVLKVVDKLIPTKKHSEDKQQSKDGEGGEGGESEGSASPGTRGHGHNPATMYGMGPGGFGTVPSDGSVSRHRNNWYENADTRIQAQADSLKRKLIAVIRENERARYVGGKRKGLINKKALSRVARGNFRIYRKRFEPKGKKYAVAIVEDCSGSMWSPAYREGYKEKMKSAHEATALFVRVFRALGFPTGLTIYGHEAKTVLNPRDRYVAADVSERMEGSTNQFYHSGGNETHKAIKNALVYLNKAGVGCQKLMVIITDGGLDGSDVRESRRLLENEMKKGDFSPMLFYVESNEQILNNEKYEAHIPNPSEDLATEAVRLMKKVVAPLQDII